MERRLAAVLAVYVVGCSRLMADDETTTLALLKRQSANLLDRKTVGYGRKISEPMADRPMAAHSMSKG